MYKFWKWFRAKPKPKPDLTAGIWVRLCGAPSTPQVLSGNTHLEVQATGVGEVTALELWWKTKFLFTIKLARAAQVMNGDCVKVSMSDILNGTICMKMKVEQVLAEITKFHHPVDLIGERK